MKKQILITYDPKTCGLDDSDERGGGDLYGYLVNELDAHHIECRIQEVPRRRAKPKRGATVTIDAALKVLTAAKTQIGGDRSLILSLTDSELEDVMVNQLVIVTDAEVLRFGVDESGYVEVRALHEGVNAMVADAADAEQNFND